MKKFVKNNHRVFIAIIITAIICITGSVYAAIRLQASEIGYKDGTVEDALNDLYTTADTYRIADNVCAYSFNNMLNFQVHLPDLTHYKTITIEKATMSAGTPQEFKIRKGSTDYINFSISDSPQSVDISELSGEGYYIFLYSRNAGDWKNHCLKGITLSK